MQHCICSAVVTRLVRPCLLPVLLPYIAQPCAAAVSTYSSRSAWESAAGPYATIDFTGFEPGTIITTQYQNLGVTFTEGNDRINTSLSLFPLDGFGLNGVIDTFTLQFDQPMHTIACEFPGTLQFRLFWQGQQFYTNVNWFGGSQGQSFGGLVSDQPFDRVVVLDPLGDVYVDDLHFGQGVPAPGTLFLVAVAAGYFGRRTRLE